MSRQHFRVIAQFGGVVEAQIVQAFLSVHGIESTVEDLSSTGLYANLLSRSIKLRVHESQVEEAQSLLAQKNRDLEIVTPEYIEPKPPKNLKWVIILILVLLAIYFRS